MKNIFFNDPFYFTLLLIIAAIIIGVISKARNKDRCLKHFNNYLVTIENITAEIITKGILKIKSTGMEIKFPHLVETATNIEQATYLIYKYEFDKIQAIILPLEELNDKGVKLRNKKFRIIKSPGFFRRAIRKTRNLFNSLKDSFIEVMNISISYLSAQKVKSFQSHDKYVRSLNTELLESVGMSHDPLLEAYIGKCVVFEFLKESEKIILTGILYDYTKKFIEILDVKYQIPGRIAPIAADLILPQKLTVIRGLCEQEKFKFKFIDNIVQNSRLG